MKQFNYVWYDVDLISIVLHKLQISLRHDHSVLLRTYMLILYYDKFPNLTFERFQNNF